MADYWTISALNNAVGISRFQEEAIFTMPPGQNGALVLTTTGAQYLHVVGGDLTTDVPTWATFANIVYTYIITKCGWVGINFSTNNAGACTNGDVNAALKLVPPLLPSTVYYSGGNTNNVEAIGKLTVGGVGTFGLGMLNVGVNLYLQLILADGSATSANAYSNSADDIVISGRFKAF